MSANKQSAGKAPEVRKAEAMNFGIAAPAPPGSFDHDAIGIGVAAEAIAIALQRAGAQVRLDDYGTTYRAGELHQSEAVVNCALSFLEPIYWLRTMGRPRLLGVVTHPNATMPDAWSTGFSQADTVLCPSEYTFDAVKHAGVKRAKLVRFGVERHFRPTPKVRLEKLRVIVSAADTTDWRVGTDLAIMAFSEAFGKRTDVELIVHTTRRNQQATGDDLGRIRLHKGPLSPDELLAFYRSADVLLYPVKADSFGAVALEAMACGTPAIHSGATGLAAFADLGLTVGHRRVAMCDGTEYREPLLGDLIDRLREVDTNYDAVMENALLDAESVIKQFSWDKAAREILAIR